MIVAQTVIPSSLQPSTSGLPLRCPVCQSPMRVLPVIDDPRVVEKILRHLGAWHDPPPTLATLGTTGPHIYEPCDDVDPMPDYKDVLTD